MTVWAVVPVKPLNRAKSRLAAVLAPEQRAELAAAMLAHTVAVLNQSHAVTGVLVISRDNRALVIARENGARTVQESGAPELNAALQRASQVIASWSAQAMLIMPADLPLLQPSDIVEVVKLGRYHQSVVLIPNREYSGTNGLLCRPPDMFPFAFGEQSYARHKAAAESAEAAVHVFRSERLMLDLDTPEDLRHYFALCQKYEMEPLLQLSAETHSALTESVDPQP